MATGIAKFRIACPLTHLDISIINPEGPGLLHKRFDKSKKNGQKNKPDQEDENLEPSMWQQIKGHDIASTDDGIKYVGYNIHEYDESWWAKEDIFLHVRDNGEVIFEDLPTVPRVDDECSDEECCCYD